MQLVKADTNIKNSATSEDDLTATKWKMKLVDEMSPSSIVLQMIEWTFRLAICQRQRISDNYNHYYLCKVSKYLCTGKILVQYFFFFYQLDTNTHLVHTGISSLVVFFILIILVSLTAAATAWGITDRSGSLLLRVWSRSRARLWNRIKKAILIFFLRQQNSYSSNMRGH